MPGREDIFQKSMNEGTPPPGTRTKAVRHIAELAGKCLIIQSFNSLTALYQQGIYKPCK
jgi:hypothetical protein